MKPRQILPGATSLVTRRTSQGMFLLRPSKEVNACIRYCLALAQRRSGVEIHSGVFLSNHYHLVVSDPRGLLPDFTEELHKLLGSALNRHRGREEHFWGPSQSSYVRLDSAHTVLAKTVYTLANPTAAGLVSHGNQWPGFRLFRKGDYRARKPRFYFRGEEAGGLPDELMLRLTPPPIDVDASSADAVVQEAVTAREKQLRDRARAAGRSFMGAAAVKVQLVLSSPRVSPRKRRISPRLACRDKWRRIELLARLESFVSEHAEKRQMFLAGFHQVVFPRGTYRFVRQFGARCAEG